jgi:hypothetical protein
MSTATVMVSSSIGYESDYCNLLALLTDVDTSLVDTLHPAIFIMRYTSVLDSHISQRSHTKTPSCVSVAT